MKIKMIHTDLDGTILTHNQKMSDATKAAFKKLHDAGYILVINTGRVVYQMLKLVKKEKIDDVIDYLVGSNGSEVYNLKTKEYRLAKSLDPDTIRRIVKKYQDEEIAMCLYGKDELFTNKLLKPLLTRSEMVSLKPTLFDYSKLSENYSKVLGIINDEDRPYFMELIKSENDPVYDVYFSAINLIEFVPKAMNKSVGTKYLIDKHGLTHDEVMAFGDSQNDIPMLEKCIGVAMGNADSNVKKLCRYQTESVDDDGFAKFVAENLLKD